LAAREIFGPLGMRDSGFCPQSSNIAETDTEVATGTVHDPRARELGGVAGHAGLFSTARDVLAYAEAVRRGGLPLLSRATVARFATSQIPADAGYMSFGWFVNGNDLLPRGDLFSNASYGHSGFTGCLMLIDPTYNASVVLLTNRVLNTAVEGMPFLRLRRKWLNAVAAAITR
jgi:CubicO group peptidase (beta-lactamase class C family)